TWLPTCTILSGDTVPVAVTLATTPPRSTVAVCHFCAGGVFARPSCDHASAPPPTAPTTNRAFTIPRIGRSFRQGVERGMELASPAAGDERVAAVAHLPAGLHEAHVRARPLEVTARPHVAAADELVVAGDPHEPATRADALDAHGRRR